MSRVHLRRVCVVLTLAAAAWAGTVSSRGGFAVTVGSVRLSSRSPLASAAVALLAAVLVWALAPADRRRQAIADDIRSLARSLAALPTGVGGIPGLAGLLAAVVACGVVGLGLSKGAFFVGGADSFGYVSQAGLWAHGQLRIEQPIMEAVRFPSSNDAWAPLGYRPAPRGAAAIVPVYAPGLPMVMALFERVGGRQAVFLVVPLFGGLAVWATYVMGRRVAGRVVGLSAAVLLASSPVFLYQLLQPMSDVPVTAWWAVALALVLCESRGAALAAGLAAGLAILTRPNLVPVAAVPGALLLWGAVRERRLAGRAAQRAVLFAAGVIPACGAVAVLNQLWYGSPLSNGYGPFDTLYRVANVGRNLSQYSRWMMDAQTPIVLLALGAPLLLWRRAPGGGACPPRSIAVMWTLFIAGIFGCYVFYAPFDAWWYLRFLLPAFPPLLLLTAVSLVAGVARLTSRHRNVITALVVGLLAWRGVSYAANHAAFMLDEGERKYAAVGAYIERQLPERSVIFAMLHSGSVRYYSGRLTSRWLFVPETRLDWLVDELRRLGYHPYLLLEGREVAAFQARFNGRSRLAALDWPPLARLAHAADVRLYDVDGQAAAARGEPQPTELIR